MSKTSVQSSPKLEEHPESLANDERSALGWFGHLTNAERHAWFASFGGLGLDAMNSKPMLWCFHRSSSLCTYPPHRQEHLQLRRW